MTGMTAVDSCIHALLFRNRDKFLFLFAGRGDEGVEVGSFNVIV